jgi:DNA-binding transcriptional ArsR family regulator
MFQALADPTRRGMVERLSRGPVSVSELAKPFAMSLPAVVQHLQMLEASGLVSSEKVGRVRTVRIEAEALSQAEQWINERRINWVKRLDRLGDFRPRRGKRRAILVREGVAQHAGIHGQHGGSDQDGGSDSVHRTGNPVELRRFYGERPVNGVSRSFRFRSCRAK